MIKRNYSFCFWVVLALASQGLLSISCASSSAGSRNTGLSTPPPGSSNNGSTNSREQNSVKAEGWILPQKDCELVQFNSEERREEGEDGSEILTHFRPESVCIYTESSANRKSLLNGRLRLLKVLEVKFNERVFMYVIDAWPQNDIAHNNNNSHSVRPFSYRIFDSDGDGKFETLVSDGVVIKPPRWTFN